MAGGLTQAPSGTVTLFFSDIEGSTRLLQQLGDRFAGVLEDHRRLMRAAFAGHGGEEVGREGDSFFVAFSRAGDAVAAAADAQRALAAHPWPDGGRIRVRMGIHTGEPARVGRDFVGLDVHLAARIMAAGHGGQVLLSATTRDLVPAIDVADLGEHRLKDFDAPQRLFQLVGEGLERTFPPIRSLAAPGAVLPRPATPTIGRDDDVRAGTDALRGTRLLTLTGPGGVGKTRLAVEVARAMAPELRDGARFAGLADVADARDVPAAIARVIDVPVRGAGDATGALVRAIGGREVLLVLDNFEQVLPAAPVVAALLDACDGLRVLVTSREATRLRAERVLPVEPLDVEAAVALFTERAQAHEPAFVLDAASEPGVADICRRLDGLPLALELAAARVGLLTPTELADRLGLGLLVGGARDAPARQRTIRATIDWSVGLLSDPERDAFARMAVFAGGATVDAAERVTGCTLDVLQSLVAKHLVRRRDRLRMLVPVREHALERLAVHPERDEVHRRLGEECLAVARAATPGLVGPDRARRLTTLDAELPNLLAVLEWAVEQPDASLALDLVWEWRMYWLHRSQREQGLRWIDAALAGGGDTRRRGRALLARAEVIGHRSSDPERDRADLREAVERFREAGDAAGAAAALSYLAVVDSWAGRHAAGEALIGEALADADQAGDDATTALVLRHAAIVAEGFDAMAARAAAALEPLRRLGDLFRITYVCSTTAYQALIEDRPAEAEPWLAEGTDAARRLRDPVRLSHMLGNRGLALLLSGEDEGAERALCEAVSIGWREDPSGMLEEVLTALGVVTARRGDLRRAATFLGYARAASQVGLAAGEEVLLRRLEADAEEAVRAHGGSGDWASWEREGAALSREEVVELVLGSSTRTTPNRLTG